MYRTIFTIILCSFCISFSSSLEFTDCGSKVGKFDNVTVSSCDVTKTACELVRETTATIYIQFTTEKSIQKVTSICHGILMDVNVPFPLKHPDACVDAGLTCPLQQGGQYNYQYSLYVDKAYPPLPVTVKWELQNEDGEDIVCVLIPSKIK
ncbi:NPC intracellular cholesterol transporter 2 homolog a-like [Prorops nasuta]|uniref:NPC intracellular cholesterol transporter 2 homolog a-like n=1 Tax=Prorops nasuta TaxID=863751 RepID=UPI0034CEFED7